MPLCFGRVGVGAGEHEDVVGEVAGRRPDLLAVEHPLVAVELGPAARGCRGRSRRWARSSPGTTCPRRRGCAAGSALLLLGAPLQERVAEHLDAEHVVAAAGRARRPWRTPRRGSPARAPTARRRRTRSASRRREVARCSCRVSRHSLDERVDLLAFERADALPVRPAGARRGTPGPSRGRPRPRRSRSAPCAARLPVGHVRSRADAQRAPADGGGADERARRRRGRPGTIAAPRGEVEPRPRRSSSAWAAAKNGVAEAERDRAGDDGEAQVEQVPPPTPRARPTSMPVRSTIVGRRPRRPAAGDRPRSPVPDASASRQPRPPQHARPAVGLDDDVADVAGVAGARRRAAGRRARCRPRRRSTRPWPMKSRTPAAAPRQPSPAPAPWRRCRRTPAGRSRSASRGAAAGSRARPGCSAARPSLAARRHRPAAADAAHRPAARRRRRAPRHVDEHGARAAPRASVPSAWHRGRATQHLAVGGRRCRPPAWCRRCRRPSDRRPCGAGPYRRDGVDRRPRGLTVRVRTIYPWSTPWPSPATDAARRRRIRADRPSPTLFDAIVDNIAARHPGQARGHRARARCACSPRATCSSRTCPASARPAWPRRWPRRSTARSDAGPVHARPAAVRRRRRHRLEPQRRASSSSGPGPMFANIVLADEINRASPKTQSALLEAMEERQVTVDGATYPLGPPVHGHRHPEPDRARGHLPPAREPARPVPHAGVGRLPDRDAELEILDTHGDHDAARRHRPGGHRGRRSRRMIDDGRRPCTWRRALKALPGRPRRRHPPPPARSRSACRPAPRSRLQRVARARAAAAGPHLRRCPTTSRRWPSPVLAHRLLVTPEAQTSRRSRVAAPRRATRSRGRRAPRRRHTARRCRRLGHTPRALRPRRAWPTRHE